MSFSNSSSATPLSGRSQLPSLSLRDVVVSGLNHLRREASARDATDYAATPKWTGSRRGFVFKHGPKGLGYYRDTAMLLPNGLPAPK